MTKPIVDNSRHIEVLERKRKRAHPCDVSAFDAAIAALKTWVPKHGYVGVGTHVEPRETGYSTEVVDALLGAVDEALDKGLKVPSTIAYFARAVRDSRFLKGGVK